jgi:hypothetical protein
MPRRYTFVAHPSRRESEERRWSPVAEILPAAGPIEESEAAIRQALDLVKRKVDVLHAEQARPMLALSGIGISAFSWLLLFAKRKFASVEGES